MVKNDGGWWMADDEVEEKGTWTTWSGCSCQDTVFLAIECVGNRSPNPARYGGLEDLIEGSSRGTWPICRLVARIDSVAVCQYSTPKAKYSQRVMTYEQSRIHLYPSLEIISTCPRESYTLMPNPSM